jgi:hypothetical protein
MKNKYWSKVEDEELKKCYNSFSIQDLSKKFNKSESTLYHKASKLGLSHQPFNKVFMSKKSRKYSLNENYFNSIDTSEKAYFLGLLYADGYVHNKKKILEVSLKKSDENTLKKLRKALKTSKPIWRYTDKRKNKKSVLAVCSENLCKHLINLGCFNKKSFIIRFPYQIPKEFYKTFIIGFFDGDGSCFVGNHKVKLKRKTYKRKFAGVNFTSNHKFTNDLYRIFMSYNFKFSRIKDKRKKNSWYLQKTGKDALNFLNWLYSNECLYMERKYRKYLEIKNLYTTLTPT